MSTGTTFESAFNLLCSHKLGSGISRVVFSSELLPDCVIKVEEGAGSFQNVVEWETWKRIQDTPMSKWFAACRWISSNGSILIMERTRPPSDAELPDMMPAFLCDFKRQNYGMVKTGTVEKRGPPKLVCHDYGTHMLFENGLTKRLRKANWWDTGAQ